MLVPVRKIHYFEKLDGQYQPVRVEDGAANLDAVSYVHSIPPPKGASGPCVRLRFGADVWCDVLGTVADFLKADRSSGGER